MYVRICLSVNENGTITLKRNHVYYHQIQGQMYMMKMNWCHFMVWTPHDYCVMLVEKDPSWESNLALLENFYHEKYIPYITTVAA